MWAARSPLRREESKALMNGKTCALVSNSAEILSARNGTLIDSNDLVVRLNLPPRRGDARSTLA